MRIGILRADAAHEASRARPGAGTLEHSILRLERTGSAVQAALEAAGHAVVPIPVNAGLPAVLAGSALDLVFNTYFGPATRQDQAHVASTLEYVRVPFTGGGAACHFVGLSKPLSKGIFQAAGLPTARFITAQSADEAGRECERRGLRFPLIVKAPNEGEGIGIDDRSVADTGPELAAAAARVVEEFAQPALVEEFLPGREFTVGVLDGEAPWVLPVLEILLPPGRTYSYAVKASDRAQDACPAEITAALRERLAELAVRAGRALGCRDCWRVDFRLDASGAPVILEVNTLPGLQPGYSDLTKMAGPAGIGYEGLVRVILESATGVSRRKPR